MANRSIEALTNLLTELPGFGPRQARRVTQYLLSKSPRYREELAGLIVEIAANAKQCPKCFRYDDLSKEGFCRICSDSSRDISLLMVVEKDVDIEGVESSGAYRGLYFVLGGLMPMTERKTSRTIRKTELMSRIGKNAVAEIIFALSTTPEGDYTARELMREIREKMPALRTTLLGRGLSIGAEIEYADSETLRNALKNRG
ncbi:MAG: recombination protein RecR [Patescibacteria group bacterium]|nr:recombination protein RecR [Patescibacteria group bacterium]